MKSKTIKHTSRWIISISTLLVGCMCSLSVFSQNANDYPTRAIKIVVPSTAGGGTDLLGRKIAQKLSEKFNISTIVENKTGAGSLIGTEYVAHAAPDGYTLMVGGLFNMVMNKALIANLSYQPDRDFIPLGYISAYSFIFLTRADLPVNSLAEFVAYAKAQKIPSPSPPVVSGHCKTFGVKFFSMPWVFRVHKYLSRGPYRLIKRCLAGVWM